MATARLKDSPVYVVEITIPAEELDSIEKGVRDIRSQPGTFYTTTVTKLVNEIVVACKNRAR